MRPLEIAACIEACYKARRPAFVQGRSGTGKSDIFRQVAAKLGIGILDLRLPGYERVDLSGIPYVDTALTKWASPDFWPREGAGIIFFDEFNAAQRELQPICYQIFLDLRCGPVVFPPAWVPFAAGNLETEGAITFKTSSAWNKRVVHLLLETHLDDWCHWAVTHDIDPRVIAFIRFRPGLLEETDPMVPEIDKLRHEVAELSDQAGISNWIGRADALLKRWAAQGDWRGTEKASKSPRTWAFCSDILKSKPPAAIEHELFKGTVGAGAAIELSGFLRIWRQLPSLDQIIINPDTVAIPSNDEFGALFAVSGGLARRATEKNFDQMTKYMMRMPNEWQTYFIKDSTRRDPELCNTDGFIRWASTNPDALG